MQRRLFLGLLATAPIAVPAAAPPVISMGTSVLRARQFGKIANFVQAYGGTNLQFIDCSFVYNPIDLRARLPESFTKLEMTDFTKIQKTD